jgi:hypothetical protein
MMSHNLNCWVPTDLAKHVLLAEYGPCEAPGLLQLTQVHYMVTQCDTQVGLAAPRPCVGTVGQVVEGEVTASRDVYE